MTTESILLSGISALAAAFVWVALELRKQYVKQIETMSKIMQDHTLAMNTMTKAVHDLHTFITNATL